MPKLLNSTFFHPFLSDRDSFASLVREVAATDIARMGIEILSFTIKDIFDNVNYLDSLGKTQTAVVKRDADIGVAEANRDATIIVRWSLSSFILIPSNNSEKTVGFRKLINE